MKKLLIANRGEIAVRVARSAKELGIATVAVVSEADEAALITRIADEVVVIGPAQAAQSYLNADAVLAAAQASGADAIHPGYGFLSENAGFAEAVAEAGIRWVGPQAETIRLMGDKVAAITAAKEAGVPTLPGSNGPLADGTDVHDIAAEIGFPLLVKASAGGGGRGIRLVEEPSKLDETIETAKTEARAAFGDDTVYLERFVPTARHVEVQILSDGTNAIHLGDRDCSMQRRSQKVLEEAPAPQLPDDVRQRICESSVALAKACGYVGAGTVEFLYDPLRQEAAFIEMNTRLQVEHPVTEAITGIDLVAWQLRIADGQTLALTQDDVTFTGHAIECRINAENPAMNFFPSPGTIEAMQWPQEARVDAGFEAGDVVPPYYDSLIAKLIVHGGDRSEAIGKMQAALEKASVTGIATTIPVHRVLVSRPEFAEMQHHTKFIESTPDLLEA